MIKGMAPGSILQFLFIRKRLKSQFKTGSSFIEVGSGNGDLSNLLLTNGFQGLGVDLNASACENNKELNAKYISEGKYNVVHSDFNDLKSQKFDFLLSCMVIEHIPDEPLKQFLSKAREMVKPGGRFVFLVPSNMKAWGIEDEIAGHVKRYSFSEIEKLAKANGLEVCEKFGLNFPLSNWLLNLSNKIVSKNEGHLSSKSDLEKTVYTGNRNVKFKTVFPAYLNIVLNEIVMLPFHWLQLLNKRNEKSLVMYFELKN
jgi:SAM-dependent methyltransferase